MSLPFINKTLYQLLFLLVVINKTVKIGGLIMTWLSNVLIEVLATIIYMFVLFPCWIVLHLCFMVLVVLLLPFKIPAINRYVMTKMKRQK